jgi:Cu(I)/Ag(I) efflux system membrane protein CusA/SilA
MALPVFGGMLVEPLTSFVVPTIYAAYLEFKMALGLPDPLWKGTEEIPPDAERVAA